MLPLELREPVASDASQFGDLQPHGRRLTKMTSFAIVLRARIRRVDGVLMILDDRKAADEIAFDLRQRGQDVEVVGYSEPLPPR